MNNEENTMAILDDSVKYYYEQCHKYDSCIQCPAGKLATRNGHNDCELYFVKEYFEKNNLKIIAKEV